MFVSDAPRVRFALAVPNARVPSPARTSAALAPKVLDAWCGLIRDLVLRPWETA